MGIFCFAIDIYSVSGIPPTKMLQLSFHAEFGIPESFFIITIYRFFFKIPPFVS